MPFTLEQQKFLVLCPRISATFSIIGSVYIIQHVARSPRRSQRVYTRLIATMSLMDLLWGLTAFASSWIIPQSDSAIYGALGTMQTCTIFGFWGHGGSLSSILYSSSLALYFLLSNAYHWNEAKIKKRIECWLHIVPILIGWITAFVGIPLTLYNPIGWTCWIGPWPLKCDQDNGVECIRGENGYIFRWVLFYIWLILSFACVASAMMVIYLGIRRREQTIAQYRFPNYDDGDSIKKKIKRSSIALFNRIDYSSKSIGDDSLVEGESQHISVPGVGDKKSSVTLTGQDNSCRRDSKQESRKKKNRRRSSTEKKPSLSRQFVTQALYYVLAFFFTWIFPLCSYVGVTYYNDSFSYQLLCLSASFAPLHGFWNALIYIRPRYIKNRKRQQEEEFLNKTSIRNGYVDNKRISEMEIVFESISSIVRSLVSAIGVDDGHDEEGKEDSQEKELPKEEYQEELHRPGYTFDLLAELSFASLAVEMSEEDQETVKGEFEVEEKNTVHSVIQEYRDSTVKKTSCYKDERG